MGGSENVTRCVRATGSKMDMDIAFLGALKRRGFKMCGTADVLVFL